MIRAVIFDFDGTLSERQSGLYDHVSEVMAAVLPYPVGSFEHEAAVQDYLIYDRYGQGDYDLANEIFLNKYSLDKDFFEAKLQEIYQHNIGVVNRLRPEALEVIESLHEQGYKVGLLTNGQRKIQQPKLTTLGIEKYFDVIIISEDVGIDKPEAAIFTLMAERLGLRNEECLMVGDAIPSDILGAYRAKMPALWFNSDDEIEYDRQRINKISNLREIFTYL